MNLFFLFFLVLLFPGPSFRPLKMHRILQDDVCTVFGCRHVAPSVTSPILCERWTMTAFCCFFVGKMHRILQDDVCPFFGCRHAPSVTSPILCERWPMTAFCCFFVGPCIFFCDIGYQPMPDFSYLSARPWVVMLCIRPRKTDWVWIYVQSGRP